MAFQVDMSKIKALVERQQTDQGNTGFQKNGWYSMRDGVQIIRFLPPWSQAGLPSKEVHKHYSLPPNNHTLMCIGPANFPGQPPCMVCEAEHEAFKVGVKLKCRAQPRFFLNGLVRSCQPSAKQPPPNPEEPVIIEIPATLHRQLMTLCGTPEIGNFFDPYQGMDVMVTRTTIPTKGDQSKTDYSVQVLLNAKGMIFNEAQGGQAKTDFVMTKMADLDKIFVFPNTEEKVRQYHDAAQAIRTIAMARTGNLPQIGTVYGTGASPVTQAPFQPVQQPQMPVMAPPAPTTAAPAQPTTTAAATPPAPVWTPPIQPTAPPVAQPPAPQPMAATASAADPKVKAQYPNGFPVRVSGEEWAPGKNAGAPECLGNISAVRPLDANICGRCRFMYPCSMVEGKYRAMSAGR